MKCPTCGKGTIQQITVEKHKAKLKGITFTVKDAKIGVCDNCDEKIYSAKEIRRWEKLLKEYLL